MDEPQGSIPIPNKTGREKRSAVWIHFTNKDGKGICRYCDCEISVKNGNISNLSRHIKVKHPTVEISPSVVFIRGDAPSMILEVEEDPLKSESDVAAACRLKWTSKSQQRERRRLKNSDNRIKQIQAGREHPDVSRVKEGYYEEPVYPEDRRRGRTHIYEEHMDDADSLPPMVVETVGTVADDPPPEPGGKPSHDDDSDRHFLLSLLPLMKKLSPEDNMDIRIQIQNTFKEKLFPPKNPLTADVFVGSNAMQ